MIPTLRVPRFTTNDSLTPLRYPGGKNWLIPLASAVLRAHPHVPFTEVFAGGASLTAHRLSTPHAAGAHLNELNADLHHFWQTVFSSHAAELAHLIRTTPIRNDAALPSGTSPAQRALRTLLLNRTQYGGILTRAGRSRAEQAGRPQTRPNRWYPDTLAQRIVNLSGHAPRVAVTRQCALNLLGQLTDHPGVIFIDPPYTATPTSAGHALYEHAQLDHAELMTRCAALRGPWFMTHEDHPDVINLARQRGLTLRRLIMQNNGHATRTELLIGRNLDWADPPPALPGMP